MKVFLDENFLIKEIVDNHIDVIVKGSTNFDEIKIYIPTSLKEQYTTIYPTYSVKRADGREIGIYNTLSTTDLSIEGYYGWKGHFQQRDIAVAGALQVTFNFNMTKDGLYQSKAIQMITTKVANAIHVDNEFLVIGEGTVESIVDTMNDMKVEMAQLEDTVEDAAETAQEAADAVDDKLGKTDVVNNLTSTATDMPLSAAMGKKLNDEKEPKIDSNHKISADNVVDGTNNKVFTAAEKLKLSGIEGGAQINVIEGIKVNGTSRTPDANKVISLTIPTQASDVNALPNTTKYCASCDLTINSSTYVMSLQLKDQNGNNLGTAKTIDLPLETMVVSGSYDSTNKKVVLTLQNGSTVEFSVADLVSGLQTEITAQNKLSSDLVDDTGHTHKFATAEQLAQIETNKNAISGKVDASKTTTGVIGEIKNLGSSIELNVVDDNNNKYAKIEITKNGIYVKDSNGTYLDLIQQIMFDNALDSDSEQAVQNKVVTAALQGKVDKVTGKGLSTNDYTNEDKAVVDSLNSVPTTTTTTANVVEVPTSAKGLATLKQIGGMSYKCKNLISNSANITLLQESRDFSYNFENGKTYTFSMQNGSGSDYYALLIYDDSNTNLQEITPATLWNSAITFTCNVTGGTKLHLYCNNVSNVNIMLNLGSTALPYEAYYEGIHDSAVTKVESVGANIWDEEWENGRISGATGKNATSSTELRSKNYNKVLPNTSYYFKTSYTDSFVFWYDINKNYIGYDTISNNSKTSPSNAYYFRISFVATTYNHDICINKSNSAINGNYYPYKTYELAIPSAIRSITGYGWGVNENCYNYLDLSLNEYKPFKQFAGRVDLGSLNYQYAESSGKHFFYVTLNEIKDSCIVLNALYNSSVVWAWENVANKEINTHLAGLTGVNNDRGFYIRDDSYSNASDFKTAMSGVYLYFELATPVITDISSLLDEVHIPIEANGTLELVNTYNNAVPVIVSFDNGLVDVVLTNHNHDIEQQKDIDELKSEVIRNTGNQTINGDLAINGDLEASILEITDSGRVENDFFVGGELEIDFDKTYDHKDSSVAPSRMKTLNQRLKRYLVLIGWEIPNEYSEGNIWFYSQTKFNSMAEFWDWLGNETLTEQDVIISGVTEYDDVGTGETVVSSPLGVFIEGQTDKVTIIKGNRVYAVANVGIHCSDKIDLLDNPSNSNNSN